MASSVPSSLHPDAKLRLILHDLTTQYPDAEGYLPFTAWFRVAETSPQTSKIVPGNTLEAHAAASLHILLKALASARAKSLRPHLMDVQMPEMDCLEATRCIRAEELLRRHTPIVAMSACMVGDRERCLAAGMDDYLSKPIDKAALLAIVEKVSADIRSS